MASSPNLSRTASRALSILSSEGVTPPEEVGLHHLLGLDEVVGADADQTEGAAVGLAREQGFGRPEHLLGRLGGGVQPPGAGEDAEVGGLSA